MIISYKIFETFLNKGNPKLHDYVLVGKTGLDAMDKFLRSNVGQIVAIKYSVDAPLYYVAYPTANKDELRGYLHFFTERPFKKDNEPPLEVKRDEISMWSKTRIDIESQLKAKSFDL